MKFEKIREEIESVNNFGGFLLIRTLKPSEKMVEFSDEQLIADIIRSKYHHWRGEEEPNGITVGMSSTDKYSKSKSWTLTDQKLYGFFDNSKIKANHYKQITYDEFYTKLTNAIEIETEHDNKYIQLSKNTINRNLKPKSTYYFLDLDKEKNEDFVAEWQVYSFFYAFISVDRECNCVYLIEFGLD